MRPIAKIVPRGAAGTGWAVCEEFQGRVVLIEGSIHSLLFAIL